MLAPSIEEMREIYLQIVTILESTGTNGENVTVIRKQLGIDQQRLRRVLEAAMAFHLLIGYGQTLGRRYVLTQLGKAVAAALREGRKAEDNVDIEALEAAFGELVDLYRGD